MAAKTMRRVTEAEYLAMLEASPTRLDLIDGRVVDPWAMEEGSPEARAGGRIRHSLIPPISPAPSTRACLAVGSDVKVRFDESGDYRFPDLTVVCGEVDQDSDFIDAPTVVVEVLSRGTEPYDRGPKFERYRKVPSIREIVLIDQNRFSVERYRRHGEVWVYEWAEGLSAQIAILGELISLADVYRRVRFPSDPPQRA